STTAPTLNFAALPRVRRLARAALDAVAATGTMPAPGRTAALPTAGVLPGEPHGSARCAGVARRAPGGPPKAEPGADAGPRRRRRRGDPRKGSIRQCGTRQGLGRETAVGGAQQGCALGRWFYKPAT